MALKDKNHPRNCGYLTKRFHSMSQPFWHIYTVNNTLNTRLQKQVLPCTLIRRKCRQKHKNADIEVEAVSVCCSTQKNTEYVDKTGKCSFTLNWVPLHPFSATFRNSGNFAGLNCFIASSCSYLLVFLQTAVFFFKNIVLKVSADRVLSSQHLIMADDGNCFLTSSLLSCTVTWTNSTIPIMLRWLHCCHKSLQRMLDGTDRLASVDARRIQRGCINLVIRNQHAC